METINENKEISILMYGEKPPEGKTVEKVTIRKAMQLLGKKSKHRLIPPIKFPEKTRFKYKRTCRKCKQKFDEVKSNIERYTMLCKECTDKGES